MRIDAPTRQDVIEVATKMRAQDEAEFLAATREAEKDDFVALLAWRFTQDDNSFCAYLDERPVAVGAVIDYGDGVLQIGMFATDDFPRIAFPLTKFVLKRLFPRYAAQGFRRVECLSLASYDEAHRWIDALGLKRVGRFDGVGVAGEDFVQFARDL